MKKLIRTCWAIFLCSYGTLELLQHYILQQNNLLGVFLIPAAAFSGLIIFVLLIYNWWKTKFEIKLWKLFWLLILVLFSYYMIGPALYYLIVFELGKTVKHT